MKTLAKIFLIITTFLFASLIFYSFVFKKSKLNEEKYEKNIFCGVANRTESKKGKKLFNVLCASCHKLNKRFIGPALGNIKDRLELRNKNYFYNFITTEDSLKNNYHVKKVNEKFKYDFTHNFNLNKKEFEELMQYLN